MERSGSAASSGLKKQLRMNNEKLRMKSKRKAKAKAKSLKGSKA